MFLGLEFLGLTQPMGQGTGGSQAGPNLGYMQETHLSDADKV